MKKLLASGSVALAAAVLLSACGGGGDPFYEDEDPSPSSRSGSVAVSSASDVALNGVYASTTVALNEVEKVNPIGGNPETCRFRFDGLRQVGTDRLLNGDIRYIPGTDEVRLTFIGIGGADYALEGTAGASVDRAGNEIDFAGAVLRASNGSGRTVTLTGSVPMREGRPEGC